MQLRATASAPASTTRQRRVPSRALRRFVHNRLALVGAALYIVAIIFAVAAPLLAPFSPEVQDLPGALAPPSWSHPFGQDALGRDVLSRIIYGSRVSLRVGIIVVAVSGLIGTSLGALSGWLGGFWDNLLMRVTDVLLAFPGMLLAIALVALLGPGIDNVILALCLTGWVGYARLVRGQVLQVREYEYVKAAISLGASPWRTLSRHVMPAVIAPLTVEATFGMAAAIIGEASLSFLGLGAQPPTPSWGSMLDAGNENLLSPHLTLFPGLAIMAVVLSLNFIGDGLRDAFDPKRNP